MGEGGHDERRRFTAAPVPADGLARMAAVVGGPGTRVAGVRRLRGGVDSATHAVRLDPGGWVVLKRSFTTDPASLAGEHDRLAFATRAPVTTPEPLALDAGGAWFGRPALVMTRVPGRGRPPDGPPRDWLGGFVGMLAAVHGTPLPDRRPAALDVPHAGLFWRPPPPGTVPRTPRLEAVVAAARSLQDDLHRSPPPAMFVHHDLHPRNMTWRSGRPVAVVDWNEARVGPAAIDVAYASVDLAMSHGPAGAAELVAAYRAETGAVPEDLPRWQLLWIASAVRWIGLWHFALTEAAGLDVTVRTLRRRLAALADGTLRQT